MEYPELHFELPEPPLHKTRERAQVTAMYFLPGVLQHHKDHGFWPGAFGGYHNGGGDWPTDGVWDDYFVKDDEPVTAKRFLMKNLLGLCWI